MSKYTEATADETPVSGEELAARFRRGEQGAFDGIVRLYQGRLFNLAYRMLNQREEAADLVQEIFIKVYGSIGQFRGESRFTTWIYAIAVNIGRNKLRSFRSRPAHHAVSTDAPVETEDGEVGRDLPDPGALPRDRAERGEAVRELKACLAGLPPEFSAAVVMRDLQQMSYQEIAAAAGCSLGTVKSRIARGRLMVTEKMRRVYHQG